MNINCTSSCRREGKAGWVKVIQRPGVDLAHNPSTLFKHGGGAGGFWRETRCLVFFRAGEGWRGGKEAKQCPQTCWTISGGLWSVFFLILSFFVLLFLSRNRYGEATCVHLQGSESELNVCMCARVCVCLCMFIYIYLHLYLPIHLSIYSSTRTQTQYAYTFNYPYIQVYANTRIQVYIYIITVTDSCHYIKRYMRVVTWLDTSAFSCILISILCQFENTKQVMQMKM